MNEHKLPKDELLGESNLNGTYRVSFEVTINEDDQVNIADFHEAVASALSGFPALKKVSRLDLEKSATDQPRKQFKPGDRVLITDDILVKADLEEYGGHLIVGAKAPNDNTIKLGEISVYIHQHMTATVNEVVNDEVELIDFDSPVHLPLRNEDTGEIEDTLVHLDSIIISNIYIDGVEE